MNIPLLNAASLQKVLYSGRTQPCIFFCEDTDGLINGEYVVKLKAGLESGATGLSSELIASQLASLLDVPTPEAAIIDIDPAMAEAIPDSELARRIRECSGLNFGSRVVTGGFETWPVGKAVPSGLKALAGEIFAFDALIQNPDRRPDKPNILWKGDELYVIDHEMGFSFIYAISPSAKPWQVSQLAFMKSHLFYGSLRGSEIKLDRFAGALELLSDETLETMARNVPETWQTGALEKIMDHVRANVQHVNGFVDEVRRTLL